MSLDPPENPTLEGMLEALAEQAERDSSGSFTLDPLKAIEKFAAYQLQGQQWALKVVQAAVAGGATNLELTFRGKEAIWRLKGLDWNIHEIEEALWHPNQRPARSIDHLRVALWSVGFGSRVPFSLDVPAWRQRLRWDGRRLHREASPGSPTVELRVAQTQTSAVQAILASCAYPCPIPFTVAGRSLKRGREGAVPLFSGYPSAALFCQLFRSTGQGSAGCFYWVKDGVLAGAHGLRGPAGTLFADFYFSDPEIPTDLTGLVLLESLPAETLRAVNQQLADSMGRLHELLQEREGDPDQTTPANARAWEVLMGFGILTMSTVPALGAVIVLGGFLGMQLSPPKASSRARRGQELTRYIGMLKDTPWQLAPQGDSP